MRPGCRYKVIDIHKFALFRRTCDGVHDELDRQLAGAHSEQVRKLPLAIVSEPVAGSFHYTECAVSQESWSTVYFQLK